MNNVSFKVSKKTEIGKLAGAISNAFKNDNAETVTITSVGNDTLQKAVKAIAAANGFLVEDGITIASTPAFEQIDIGEGRSLTAITQTITKIN